MGYFRSGFQPVRGRRLMRFNEHPRGGLVVNAASMKKFMKERGFLGALHATGAKNGEGCDQFREAIVQAIDWKSIPETTSPALYHRLKQEILSLRDSGLVLIRLAELIRRFLPEEAPERWRGGVSD